MTENEAEWDYFLDVVREEMGLLIYNKMKDSREVRLTFLDTKPEKEYELEELVPMLNIFLEELPDVYEGKSEGELLCKINSLQGKYDEIVDVVNAVTYEDNRRLRIDKLFV